MKAFPVCLAILFLLSGCSTPSVDAPDAYASVMDANFGGSVNVAIVNADFTMGSGAFATGWRIFLEDAQGFWWQHYFIDQDFTVHRFETGCSQPTDHCRNTKETTWHPYSELPPAGIFWNEIAEIEAEQDVAGELRRIPESSITYSGGNVASINHNGEHYEYDGHFLPLSVDGWGRRAIATEGEPLQPTTIPVSPAAAISKSRQDVLGANEDVFGFGQTPKQQLTALLADDDTPNDLTGRCIVSYRLDVRASGVDEMNRRTVVSQWVLGGSDLRQYQVVSTEGLLGWGHEVQGFSTNQAFSSCQQVNASKWPAATIGDLWSDVEALDVASRVQSLRITWGGELWTPPGRDSLAVTFSLTPDWVDDSTRSWQAYTVSMNPYTEELHYVSSPADWSI